MLIREAEHKDLQIILDIMKDAILNTTSIYDYEIRTNEFVENWLKKSILTICPFWYVKSMKRLLLMVLMAFSEPGMLISSV